MGRPSRSPANAAAFALSLTGLSLAGPAAAQHLSGLGATHVYGPVADQLATQPSDDEVMAAWPARARAKDLGGSAVMRCVADSAGALSGCHVMLERSHAGFGDALVSLAPKYRLKPAEPGQRPDGAEVVVTATWPAPETPVDWQTAPKAHDFATTMTPAVQRSGGRGVAVMNCLAAQMGALHDCTVVYQAPAAVGYGTMALRFQGFLQLKPATLQGKRIASGVDIVFNFHPMAPGETF
ncbi:hypothetical protein [Phenylobacterium sp.]|uniref:hypothetical protein n=1 Tax=Phenylobacterium sp. TaxID=1871053 RepID=UPI00121AA12C|nr:hypothetical protein [Phenylobacterium sp.]THD62879.1 MAG: hypothetical protein E8A49_05825 [Phenylobacterium sp.]